LAPVVTLKKGTDGVGDETSRNPGESAMDSPPERRPSDSHPVTRHSRLAIPGLALLALLGLGVWWLRPDSRGQSPDADRNSVAVLPFVNMTGDSSKEYLADGVAEELINALARIPGLKVPARSSSFAYKGRNIDVRNIARDLKVGTLLEGSVRTAGQRIRITVQLVDARDGLHLWSETYDEESGDLFKLQDSIAAAVAAKLRPSLTAGAVNVTTQPHPTNDLVAYNLYLQGVSLVHRTSAENCALAIKYFQQALDRDPKFARAYAMLAEAEIGWSNSAHAHLTEHRLKAEHAARVALQLDPTLANAHTALAGIVAGRGNFVEMGEHRRAALSSAPDDAFVHAVAAALFCIVGQLHAGLDEATRAYALAPASPFVVSYLAYVHSVMGHDDEALRLAQIAQDLGFPEASWPLTTVHAFSLIRHRRFPEAARLVNSAMDRSDPEEARDMQIVSYVMTTLQHRMYSKPATFSSQNTFHPVGDAPLQSWDGCFDTATSYALIDALDIAYEQANRCLDRATPQSSHGELPLTLLWWTPELRGFRSDPQFQALSSRVGYADYALRYGPPDDCELKDGKLTCH
jgi:TolB-like protein/tetratricopeptide (TPR) repeat protein